MSFDPCAGMVVRNCRWPSAGLRCSAGARQSVWRGLGCGYWSPQSPCRRRARAARRRNGGGVGGSCMGLLTGPPPAGLLGGVHLDASAIAKRRCRSTGAPTGATPQPTFLCPPRGPLRRGSRARVIRRRGRLRRHQIICGPCLLLGLPGRPGRGPSGCDAPDALAASSGGGVAHGSHGTGSGGDHAAYGDGKGRGAVHVNRGRRRPPCLPIHAVPTDFATARPISGSMSWAAAVTRSGAKRDRGGWMV